MKIRIILIAMLCIIFAGCQSRKTYTVSTDENGIEVVNNSGEPSKPGLSVGLNMISSIKGYNDEDAPDGNSFYNVLSLCVDDSSNVYLMDGFSQKIFKYTENGEFITKFSGKGKGPGELTTTLCKHYCLNGNIVIAEGSSIHQFDRNGTFIGKADLDLQGFFSDINDLDNSKFVAGTFEIVKKGDNGYSDIFLKHRIKMFDYNYSIGRAAPDSIENSVIDIINKDIEEGYLFRYAVTAGGGNVYIAKRDFNRYEVTVHDDNLRTVRKIAKIVSPIVYSESEIEFIRNNITNKYTPEKFIDDVFPSKPQIHDIHYDEVSNLLFVELQSELDSGIVMFDVFRDGVYLVSFEFPIMSENYNPMNQALTFKIKSGKLYFYNQEQNELVIYTMNIE